MDAADARLRAKARYVAAARRCARFAGTRAPAPGRGQRIRHWVHSLPLVYDWRALTELDVPWWTYRASAAVDAWLHARREPVRAFEYGAGASTFWLARRAAEVHSVEHDREFAANLGPALTDYPAATLHIVPAVPTLHPAVPSAKEGYRGLDFANYVAAIDGVPGYFDVIVIDGRARAACLAVALRRLADGGLIVFDNSLRSRYRAAIRTSELRERRYFGLTPTLPYPEQTSLLTRRQGSRS
jgi:predicted O-methyltransferase YrrM